jgi:preprotein translocase subunit SecA
MAQAVTQYSVLYESLRSRRTRPIVPTGLDRMVGLARVRLGGLRQGRQYLLSQAEQACLLTPEYRNTSDAALRVKLSEMREAFARQREGEEQLRHALAMLREVARRETGEEPYPVQLMAALALYHGRIVEMLTGEGKTLTGSLAAALIAWRRRRLHVLTVNDYLAQRDAESRAGLYRWCGLSCGAIVQATGGAERFEIYSRSIVYGSPKQIVADWLRDQLKLGGVQSPWQARAAGEGGPFGTSRKGELPMVPGLHAALVDEADAVLIDEGVVPLIIARSRREDDMSQVYREAAAFANKLDEGNDYVIDHVRKRCVLKERGEERLVGIFGAGVAGGQSPLWKATRRGHELVRQALVAKHCYLLGQQYAIVDGKVVIVDEYTGRFLADRSWEHGLHQAVEAKESVEVTADRETLARQSFQRFFRTYPFLCGMTGTSADATPEIEGVYGRSVVRVPTHRPLIRTQEPLQVFRTQRDKWSAIVDNIERVHNAGRPVLVGTRSIASSELLSTLLAQRNLPHQVLNANHDKEEAQIIVGAGKGRNGAVPAAITVATNMAGRGTDIKLDSHAREAGGLHVVLTELHGALRIDRQFIGRAGRQGDPGSAAIFVSLEDEICRKFIRWPANVLRQRSKDANLSSVPGIARLMRFAQQRSEARDRRNRMAVLKQDDWIDKHLPGVG